MQKYEWIIGLLLIPVFILVLYKYPTIKGFCIRILWGIIKAILGIFF